MPYQPGPFGQASPADIHVEPGVYDFTDDAAGLQNDLSVIAAGWDPLITNLLDFAAEPWDVDLGLDIDGLLSLSDTYGSLMPPGGLTDALNGWFDTQALLGVATSFAPVQAWTDPGAAFVPPLDNLTLVPPTIDPNAYTPAPNTTVGGLSNGVNPFVGLFNQTRTGAANFTQGDNYEIVALGKEGDQLTATGVLNGENLPMTDYGTMDQSGQIFLTGTMGPDAVGIWQQQWFINGAILAQFNFTVSPASST